MKIGWYLLEFALALAALLLVFDMQGNVVRDVVTHKIETVREQEKNISGSVEDAAPGQSGTSGRESMAGQDAVSGQSGTSGGESMPGGKAFSGQDVAPDDTSSGRSAEELPQNKSLDVPEILQMPELPTGCESVALTMALVYAGYELEKTTIARDFLVYNREDDNMALGYVGDPFSASGAGCFAPALCRTARQFLREKGEGGTVRDLTGTELEELLPYIASGTPVIVWTTMYMAEPDFTGEAGTYQGREYRWYRQEHCVVLSGYNLEDRTLRVNDPLEGIVTRNMDAFRAIYDKTGQNAIVVEG